MKSTHTHTTPKGESIKLSLDNAMSYRIASYLHRPDIVSTPQIDSIAFGIARKRASFHAMGAARKAWKGSSRITRGEVFHIAKNPTGYGDALDAQAMEEMKLAARAELLASVGRGEGFTLTATKEASKKAFQELHHATHEKTFDDSEIAEKANDLALRHWRESEGIEGYAMDKAKIARAIGNLKKLRKAFRLYWQAKGKAGYKKHAHALKNDLKMARKVILAMFKGGWTMPARATTERANIQTFQNRSILALSFAFPEKAREEKVETLSESPFDSLPFIPSKIETVFLPTTREERALHDAHNSRYVRKLLGNRI